MKKTPGLALLFLTAGCISGLSPPGNAPSTPVEVEPLSFGALPRLKVAFAPSARPLWNGKRIPPSQTCSARGGNGHTPALSIKRIPKDANVLILEINDPDCPPLAFGGGLGAMGFPVPEGAQKMRLPPLPGESHALPEGVFREHGHRGIRSRHGNFEFPACGPGSRDENAPPAWTPEMKDHPAYLPPCSGAGHAYYAEVKAYFRPEINDSRKQTLLAVGRLQLGRDRKTDP